MRKLSIQRLEELEGGSICGPTAGAATGVAGAAYISRAALFGARLGIRLGFKGAIVGALVGAAAGGVCLAFS